MSKILASYIDSLFDINTKVTPSEEENAFSTLAEISITPCYVMGLALAVSTACILDVSPIPRPDERKLRRFGDVWTPDGYLFATARVVVPAHHPLYSRALNHDQYAFNVRLTEDKVSLACDAVGQEVRLPRASGNWRVASDGTPGWLLATFPQHGYALISARYLATEMHRLRAQLN